MERDTHEQQVLRMRAEQVIRGLARNNMQGFFAERAADVSSQVEKLLSDGDTVAVGGSMTLAQTGVLELLHSGRYRFLDRYAAGLSAEEVRRIYVESFGADVYLSSVNAVTLDGELYNVDGNGNRVAAICYGPRSVILIAGINKIVRDVDEAIARIKQFAAPENAMRLQRDTPCTKTGTCAGLHGGMTAGCRSEERICCHYVVSAYQREKNRIKVILVGEPLGY